jgi:hypothetical protein
MAGRDKSKQIDETSRSRLTPGETAGSLQVSTIYATEKAAPATNNIPLQREAISNMCTHPFSYHWIDYSCNALSR